VVPRSDQALTVCSAILNETPLTRWIGAPEVRFRRETQEVNMVKNLISCYFYSDVKVSYKEVNREKYKSAPVGHALVKQQVVVLGEATEINIRVSSSVNEDCTVLYIGAYVFYCCLRVL